MLQDLDSLAARVGQMVRFTRQLQAERETLQTRLKRLEQERDALRDQIERQKAEYQSVAERLDQHAAEVGSVKAEAEASQSELKVEVEHYRREHESLQQSLAAARAGSSRLQAVASSARDRIDAILVRLPGAPQE